MQWLCFFVALKTIQGGGGSVFAGQEAFCDLGVKAG
jgi:hypothetical protein